MSTSTHATNAIYADCVSSLRSSLSFLESSVSTLGNGVEDYPRLVSVLKTVRVRHDAARTLSWLSHSINTKEGERRLTRNPTPALRTNSPAHPRRGRGIIA